MFIARISTGRTVREFVLGALLAPSLIFMLWMTIFGHTAILQFFEEDVTAVADSGGAAGAPRDWGPARWAPRLRGSWAVGAGTAVADKPTPRDASATCRVSCVLEASEEECRVGRT